MVTHEQHVMRRETALATDAEEWVCPTCGRRLRVEQLPVYSTTVLAAGDTRATHCGGAGAAGAPAYGVDATDRVGGGADADDIPLEMLRPWLKALRAIEDEGFEGL